MRQFDVCGPAEAAASAFAHGLDQLDIRPHEQARLHSYESTRGPDRFVDAVPFGGPYKVKGARVGYDARVCD